MHPPESSQPTLKVEGDPVDIVSNAATPMANQNPAARQANPLMACLNHKNSLFGKQGRDCQSVSYDAFADASFDAP